LELKDKIKFKQTELGTIPEHWEIDKLENHLIIKGRIGWKGLQISEYVKDGPFIVGGLQIKNNNVIWEECAHVTPSRYEESPEIMLRESDILMTKDGTIGKLAYIKKLADKATVASHIHVIRKKTNKVLPQFLFYFFKSPRFQNMIESKISGSVVPALTQKDINNTVFPIPPIQEQQSIGIILSDLDSKIELNRKMNKTLKSIGQVIFNHWFIDFEFPNKEGKPYKSSGGEMVYNEVLETKIPKQWKVGKLGEFIDLDRGLSYKGSYLSDKGFPMINLGTISPIGFISEGLKYYTGEYNKRQLVKVGDIVIANTDITQKREVLGSPAIVPPYLETALFTHHIFAVRNKSHLPNSFIFHLLQLNEYKDRVKGFATGTTVLALPKDAILEFNFVVPDIESLEKFNSIYSCMLERSNLCDMQNRNLSYIRDRLLIKLISGKIRIPLEVK
jgi:type I restriction enzyme S subunit